MVRVKHRYLLVNILYPESSTSSQSNKDNKINDQKIRAALPTIVDFRQPSPGYLTPGLLIKHVREHIEQLFGEYGAGATGAGLTIKYFSQATSTFIIRCARTHYRLLWAALTYISSLPMMQAHHRHDGLGGRKQHNHHQPLHQQVGGNADATTDETRSCVMRVIRVSGTIRKSEEEAIRRARNDILKAQRQVASSNGSLDLDPGATGGTLGALMGGSRGGLEPAGHGDDTPMDDISEGDDDDSDEENE